MTKILMSNNQRVERLQTISSYILIVFLSVSGIVFLWDVFCVNNVGSDGKKLSLDLSQVRETVLSSAADEARPHNPACRFWNCLNLYRCGQKGHDRLTVYVYPLQDFVEETNGKLVSTFTREYYQILEAVVQSSFYSSNPNEACLFLPSIDLLNEALVEPNLVGRSLAALDYWDNGENHLIFNMISHSNRTFGQMTMKTDRAIMLGANFDTWTYRPGFDVSLPVWSPALQSDVMPFSILVHLQKKFLLIVMEINKLSEQKRLLHSLAQDNPFDVLLLRECKAKVSGLQEGLCCNDGKHTHQYPHILRRGTFCLLTHGTTAGQINLIEILASNCIPVIAINNYVLPFEDVLDWSLFSVRIRESELHSLVSLLKEMSQIKTSELKRHGRWVYHRYFKDLTTITQTALEILENRIFPHRSRSLKQWNTANDVGSFNPLFLPIISPKSQGFTAVILTYDRVESLISLIQKLAVVPSLQSILVVWNNQNKLPPHLSAFPTILKPLKIIQTRANKLSNRFYPYNEIETEAILTIDDDINMLTTDELDFGFEVWREFPDRIVGFPSRIHVWNNESMNWYYESEWTNQISMVLTGAAFHHKFWSHMYTYAMPGDIKDWVDKHMNCEDIAMNFLVANITNKPPIKVTPRKKFKCPECTNTEMLSADLNHMRERSACIDRFACIYGRMPLRSVEFRADPVLFRDNFPEKLKRFNDIVKEKSQHVSTTVFCRV